MKRNAFAGFALLGVLLLTACSEAPKPAATDAKSEAAPADAPAAPVTGKTAYWAMYAQARANFATDLMPVSLESKEIPGIKNEDGKAAMWKVTFVSATKNEARVYTYAIVAHPPDIYKGVTVGGPLPWNGSREVVPFGMGQVSVDSDVAFKSASADAAAWLKQHPLDNPTVTLKDLARFQIPTWMVMWGDEKKLGYRAFVNGVNGKPMNTK